MLAYKHRKESADTYIPALARVHYDELVYYSYRRYYFRHNKKRNGFFEQIKNIDKSTSMLYNI